MAERKQWPVWLVRRFYEDNRMTGFRVTRAVLATRTTKTGRSKWLRQNDYVNVILQDGLLAKQMIVADTEWLFVDEHEARRWAALCSLATLKQ